MRSTPGGRSWAGPIPFVVVEAGAGTGTLARTVLLAEPACAPALRYVLVERSAALRVEHGRRPAAHPAAVRASAPRCRTTTASSGLPASGIGPVVVSLGELPSLDRPVVVLANELLDNLAFRILERAERVERGARRPRRRRGALTELLVPAEDDQLR